MSGVDWRARAACRNSDPRLFDQLDRAEVRADGSHPGGHERIRQAIAVCVGCPVLEACGQWAEENNAVGVFGTCYRKQGSQPLSAAGRPSKRRAAATTAEEASFLLRAGQSMRAVAVRLDVSEPYLRQLLGGGKRAAA